MNNELTKMNSALIDGDLSKLSPAEKLNHYMSVCNSLGLNPLTKPFAYIQLNGKLVLYATRDCTDQLRASRKISMTISDRSVMDDIYVVTAKAKTIDGLEDESTGAVNIAGLKGEQKANAFMKAETKAKRRLTLSICGLGFTDESEIDSIPGAKFVDIPTPQNKKIELMGENTVEKSFDDAMLEARQDEISYAELDIVPPKSDPKTLVEIVGTVADQEDVKLFFASKRNKTHDFLDKYPDLELMMQNIN